MLKAASPTTHYNNSTAPHTILASGTGRPLLLKNAINGAAYRHAAVGCCLHATPYTLLHARGKYSPLLLRLKNFCQIGFFTSLLINGASANMSMMTVVQKRNLRRTLFSKTRLAEPSCVSISVIDILGTILVHRSDRLGPRPTRISK